ncbi:MAG: ribonuclease E/G [Eubacterium sp.]|nr:ribonuclease E/G [Eubacterium sp.]
MQRRQILITDYKDKICCAYLEGDKPYDLVIQSPEGSPDRVGNVILGRVEHIVKNISAAFVKIGGGLTAYLSLTPDQLKNLRCNDEVLVQVKKAAVKTKNAVLSQRIELVYENSVICLYRDSGGISKKIQDPVQKDRLKKLLEKYSDCPFGLVLRTNAATASDETMIAEIDQGIQTMEAILQRSKTCQAPGLLMEAKPFYLDFIQSYQRQEIDRIVTDMAPVFDFLQKENYPCLEFYEDPAYELKRLFGLEQKIQKALDKNIWLSSGGNLIIEPTEALTVIDVNTGRAVEGKRQAETTFFKINMEAAKESARQIRLRNLSGMILIDFIDMKEEEHERELVFYLKQELAKDKIKCMFIDITKLGLVEITRMKKNKSLREMLIGEAKKQEIGEGSI